MEELVAIVSVFVILPAILTSAVVRVRTARYEAQGRSGDGLRASELHRLIRDAVAEAVEPLEARLDALEGRARPPRDLDPGTLADVLDPDLDAEWEDAPPAVRRRARS